MSDTVKLIIEIPKDYYEVLSKTEVILTSQRSGKTFMSVIYSAVKNGIPLDDVKAEIKSWYWQVEKQSLAKDPCVVDAMVDLFIRTIDNIGNTESVSEKEKRNREVITDIVKDR